MTTATTRLASLAALTLSLALGSAAHADTGLTREQVKAELAQAQRNGDLIDYETGLKQNQLFPSAYPAAAATAAQIKPVTSRAVTRASQAGPALTGDIVFDAVVQRNAEALARRPATLEDSQFAGK
ncbi:MAG: DUF4148 domain-containing protein [Rubrivivax sp.]|nr:MAG: DUF4148 domain-containing protein [Rubrivivax sp.]